MNSTRRRAALGHSARVAAFTTALIAVVYIVVIGTLDSVIFSRLATQVDLNLAAALKVARPQPFTPAEGGRRPGNLEDAPILLWKVSTRGRATPLTAGAPSLPARKWPTAAPVTASLDGGSFRLEASRESSGWLVAGQSLAGPDRVRSDLLVTEAVLTPFLLLAVYLGSFTIGLRAAAPVERIRQRQLEFTADASHELRTPLSVIEAEAELALSAPRPAAGYRAALSQVINESQRLRRIVEDLLWLARFDSEPPPPGHEPVDLELIAAKCAERFRAVADARGIRLTLRHDQTVHALVTAPPEWIDRLLGVLVDNACRYCIPGGTVAMTTRAAGSRACVVVEDDGPGIPEQDQERLFDRFHRATSQPGGAGLGLAIADAIVRSTGGRWTVARSPAGGAHMEVSWHRPATAHGLLHPGVAKASLDSQPDRGPAGR
jgi:signal transduction histidine kinase